LKTLLADLKLKSIRGTILSEKMLVDVNNNNNRFEVS